MKCLKRCGSKSNLSKEEKIKQGRPKSMIKTKQEGIIKPPEGRTYADVLRDIRNGVKPEDTNIGLYVKPEMVIFFWNLGRKQETKEGFVPMEHFGEEAYKTWNHGRSWKLKT